MKTKLTALLTAALGSAFAHGQETPPPPAPPVAPPPVPPAEAARPPAGPRPDGERRPEGPRRDGERGLGDGERGPREHERPRDGDRGPQAGPRDGDRPPGALRDGERPKAGPPDGPRENLRDGPREPGSPRDGERGPGGKHDGFHGERGPGAGVRPQKATAYLGIATAPVPLPLGTQLGLAEGFGLLVEQVVPDSPALTAGVQRFDVLKYLNDQQLVAPEQLATLVRGAGKDAEVTLTVLRKGAELKLPVKVGERLLPERPAGGRLGDLNWRLEPLRQLPEMARDVARRGEDQAHRIQEQFRGFQQRMGEFQKRLQDWQKNPSGKPPEAPQLELPKPPEPPRAPEGPRPADLLRESRPGGAAQIRVDQDGNVTTWNTAQARILIKDDRGEIDLRSEAGKRLATVKNAQGEVVFDGPVDTAEQRAALPGEVRQKIELNGVEALDRPSAGTALIAPESDAKIQ